MNNHPTQTERIQTAEDLVIQACRAKKPVLWPLYQLLSATRDLIDNPKIVIPDRYEHKTVLLGVIDHDRRALDLARAGKDYMDEYCESINCTVDLLKLPNLPA